MLASEPTTVADLYEWLPPDGETNLSFQYDGSRLCVEIHFEDETDEVDRKRNLVFTGVCSMSVSSVPGVNTLDLQYSESHSPTGVVEYMKSEAAEAWSQHFGWTLRHFRVHFGQENKLLTVFAEEVAVE